MPERADLASLCGRADLLRAFESGGRSLMDDAGAILGYRRLDREDSPQDRPGTTVGQTGEMSVGPDVPEAPEDLAAVPFWQMQEHELEPEEDTRAGDETLPPPVEWSGLGSEPPDIRRLATWADLLPRFRAGAAERRESRALDIEAIVRDLGKGRIVRRLPRRRRPQWGRAIHIIRDRAERLTPFWQDEDDMAARLAALFPQNAAQHACVWDGSAHPWLMDEDGGLRAWPVPEPGTLVVVLGDLGCLARGSARPGRFWARLGQSLVEAGCRPVAVTPAPARRWRREVARHWRMIPWERSAAGPTGLDTDEESAERLLALISPAVRVEPGFLRDARRILGPGKADAGTEADVWQHAAMISRHSVAGTLDAQRAKELRRRFAEADRRIREAVLESLRRWRAGKPEIIFLEEVLNLDPASQALPPVCDAVPAARASFAQLARQLDSETGAAPVGWKSWADRVFARATDRGWPFLHDIWTARNCDRVPSATPPGFRPSSIPPVGEAVGRIDIRQSGAQILASPQAGAPEGGDRGSLLGFLDSTNGWIVVEPQSFWKSGIPPAWAHDWGHDEFGAWVSFVVEGADGTRAEQRLRWIPAGEFLMGSPGDEPGRFEDEGPQHEVTIRQGFWMADTACTQALWQVVMKSQWKWQSGEETDPSNLKGDLRPVESVGQGRVYDFLRRINNHLLGVDLRLPTEAEWEYACRAGTTTPYSFGNEADPELVNYAAGETRRGVTFTAKSLPPNPWGLYEMHGNVDELVEDHWHDRYEGAPEDGSAWNDKQAKAFAERVLRGGSWIDPARHLRSAARRRHDNVMGSDLVGFRCARVQAGAEPADQRRVRQAEGRTAVDRLDGAQVLQPAADPPKIACPIPQAPSIIVRSDCERLTFRQVTQPDWASAIGRDRFGVWVEIEVPPDSGEPVTQRLRWIAPGRFTMGSPEEEPGRAEREGPQHLVTISRGFWLADTACSQALWQAVTGKKNPSAFKGDDRPVERVSWNDVQDFLRQLEELLPGCGADLPTEAEWEYACRAGTTTPFSFGDSVTREQVNHAASETVPVKSLPPNAWGLYEMHGNVWEWCADGRRAYDASPQVDPKGPEGEDTPRVLRGGSWVVGAGNARSAFRNAIPPGFASRIQGFRFCLRSIEPGQEPGRPGGPAGRAPGRRPAASPRDEAKPARKTRRRTRK